MPLIHNVCREFLTTEVNKLKGFVEFYKKVKQLVEHPENTLSVSEQKTLLEPFERVYKLVGDNPEAYLREEIGMSFSPKDKDGLEQDTTTELTHKLLNYFCSPLFTILRLSSAAICNRSHKIEAILKNCALSEAEHRSLMNCLIMPVQVASNAAMFRGRFYDSVKELNALGDENTVELAVVADLFDKMASAAGQYINLMKYEDKIPPTDIRFVSGGIIDCLANSQALTFHHLLNARRSFGSDEQEVFDYLLCLCVNHFRRLSSILDANTEPGNQQHNITKQRAGSRRGMQVPITLAATLPNVVEATEAQELFESALLWNPLSVQDVLNKLIREQKELIKKDFRNITQHLADYFLAWSDTITFVLQNKQVEFIPGENARYRIPTRHIVTEQNVSGITQAPLSPRILELGDNSSIKGRGRSTSAASALLTNFKKKVSSVVRSIKEESKDSIPISPPSSPRTSESSVSSQSLFTTAPNSPRTTVRKGSDPLISELQERLHSRESLSSGLPTPKS